MHTNKEYDYHYTEWENGEGEKFTTVRVIDNWTREVICRAAYLRFDEVEYAEAHAKVEKAAQAWAGLSRIPASKETEFFQYFVHSYTDTDK